MGFQPGYLSEDTIAAISTQTGGALSIVRMSGTQAFETLNHVTRSNQSVTATTVRKLIRSYLYLDNGSLLDDCLFVCFSAPQSYTGENIVEFHIHGGVWIAHSLMEALLSHGLRQALPGEFSFRAVRNGKMSLFQAQGVADLISAQNENAAALALEKMSAQQNQLLNELGTELRQIATLAEVGIDFVDQDIEEISLLNLQLKTNRLVRQLTHLKDTYHRGSRLQDGVRVVLIGLPNSGKSSFFNAILGEDRSIVSEHAGTTRDIIREKLTLKSSTDSVTLHLEDTAGLRSADDPVEKIGIQRTQAAFQRADLILLIVDPTVPPSQFKEQWDQLYKSQSELKKIILGVITKSDLLQNNPVQEVAQSLQSLGVSKWVLTSAKTGKGITQSADEIIRATQHLVHRDHGELVLTRLEHFNAAESALVHLERAASSSDLDLFAADIRQTLHSLAPLIGETLSDDILTKIFSNFCIGK